VLRSLAAALLVLVACTSPPAPDASGEEIYLELCARCHADDLSGGIGPAVGSGSNSAIQPDSFLALTITRGRGRMPSFGSVLDQAQVDRLVAYIRQEQQG
jgi:mono/diheme cytochrome c family protein